MEQHSISKTTSRHLSLYSTSGLMDEQLTVDKPVPSQGECSRFPPTPSLRELPTCPRLCCWPRFCSEPLKHYGQCTSTSTSAGSGPHLSLSEPQMERKAEAPGGQGTHFAFNLKAASPISRAYRKYTKSPLFGMSDICFPPVQPCWA
jgi:hypothetical protein